MAENQEIVENQQISQKQLSDFDDNECRQETRRNYRNIIHELQEHKEELINPESNELEARLKKVEELFKPDDQRPREVALDGQAMHLIANMGRMKAQALDTEFVRFQPTEFAIKVKSFVDAPVRGEDTSISDQGWSNLGLTAQQFLKKTAPFQFMLGSFERGPKPVKERQQRVPKEKDNVVGKETVPTQLKNFSGDNQSEATSEEVERVLKILRDLYHGSGGRPLDYFEFVLNPDSFGHTVENIFHVSFLVRDGLAAVFLDDEKLPVIKPTEPGKKGSKEEEKRNQAIVSMTPKEWREFVKVFEVQEAQIQPRPCTQNGDT